MYIIIVYIYIKHVGQMGIQLHMEKEMENEMAIRCRDYTDTPHMM